MIEACLRILGPNGRNARQAEFKRISIKKHYLINYNFIRNLLKNGRKI